MRRAVRSALTGAVATAVLVGGVALPTTTSYAAAPTYTAMTFQPSSGSSTHPRTMVLGSIQVWALSDGLAFDGADTSGSAFVELRAPTGTLFQVGLYATLDQPDATHAGFHQSAAETGCQPSGSGTLDVLEISADRDPDTGLPASFAATFSYACGGGTVTGELRHNSPVPYAVAAPTVGGFSAVRGISFGTVEETTTSAPQSITYTSAGPTATQFSGPAQVVGTAPDSFRILSDGCANQTLSGGASCVVSVAARPWASGQLEAVLQLPDNSAGGAVGVELNVNSTLGVKGTFHHEFGRLLDTRLGLGAPQRPVAGGSTIHLQVTGAQLLPYSGMAAVVLNLTETGSSTGGYVTAYPTGQPRPTASTINYTPGVTRANMVTVPIGAGGKVDLYNCCGHVHLIADVLGWYAKDDSNLYGVGWTLQSVAPERFLDTRQWTTPGLPGGYEAQIAMDYGADFNSTMDAALVTVTAVRPRKPGYLQAYNGISGYTSSTLNLQPGVTTTNLAIVPTQPCKVTWCKGYPSFKVYNGSSGPTNVLVDVLGVFTGAGLKYGMRYQAITPTRIVDTRGHLGAAPLGPASTTVVTPPASLTGYYTGALMANVTAVKPTASTYLTLWLDAPGVTRPAVSSSNPPAGSTVANVTLTRDGVNNAFDIYNASGTTNVAIDLQGTFEYFPPDVPAPPAFAKATPSTVKPAQRRAVVLTSPGPSRRSVGPSAIR